MNAPLKTGQCSHCGHSNAPEASRCASCGSWFGSDGATVTSIPADSETSKRTPGPDDLTLTHAVVDSDWSKATAAGSRKSASGLSLEVGSILADRYEILKLLGEGGMGAVYKARDRELDRLVALKIIRSELAGRASILQRFKQELILARKITHRNIIRIYDLGVAEGLRFITMEFVEGQDLSSLLEEKKFSPREAVAIIKQVVSALEAAHAEGVVHRDLKPQNIMLEPSGRVCVMDFGLARSLETTGLTQVGAVMGTPAYMSPEQAKGETADARSDLYSMGIVFYQMLTGQVPFKADSPMATMLLRTQGLPTPPIKLDPHIPRLLNDIVLKTLAVKPEERYQSATDIAQDLQAWEQGGANQVSIITPKFKMMPESSARKWIALSVTVVVVMIAATAGVVWYRSRPAPPVAPMTVIIADFNNHTGDSVFTGTLESTLRLALEGASFISAYDRTKMRDLGLKAVSGTLDDAKAQEIAASQGLNVVVSGSLDRRGTDYQLSVQAVQTVTGKVLANADAAAPNKDQVLFAVTKLGIAVRKALGDATSESAQRLSMETLTAASLEAVHEYAAGLDESSAGNLEEAIKHLSRAVDLDPNFGMAYTTLASATRNVGRFQEADQYITEALRHIDHMTERERYRTRAYRYLLSSDHQKCVDEYGSLLERYPADTGAYTNIAICLIHLHNVPRALEEARRAVAILPKRAIYHANLAMDLAYTGDFQTAAKEAAETLKLGYVNGYLLQAYTSLGQDQPAPAEQAYRNLQKTIPSDATTGLADLAVYEGRYAQAVTFLEEGAAADMAGRKPDLDAAATKFWMLAHVQLLRGQTAPAMAAAKRALDLSKAFQTRFAAAEVYAALGEAAKAQELAAGLSSELQIEPQAYGKLIEGEIALHKGDGRGAVAVFTAANNLLDTWIGRFDLGRAYLEIGEFTSADSEFDRCLKRRGEVLSLFLDLPTYGYFPPVYYYQGRAREGMKSAGFTESYKKYLSIRGKAGEDPLLAEVRRRAGQ